MRAVFAWGMAAAIATALLFGVAAVLQAVGARDVPSISEHPWREVLSRAVRSKVLMAVLGMHVFGGVLHLLSAVWLPLYLAQAVMASSVVVTAFYAAHLLGEHLRTHQRVAVLATVGGLVLLTVGAGSAGEERVTEHFLWILVVVLVMGTLAATFAVASSSRSAAITLAAVGGAAYAITPFAARGLGSPVLSVENALSTFLIVVGSLVGFVFYSFSLQRVSTIAATGPLILAETLLPAIVGVAFLHDRVRPGWWPETLLGLALAIGGVLVLSNHAHHEVEELADQ